MDKIRVIIAEDHTFVREATRQLLEQEPDIEIVGEATDGAEAGAPADRLKPHDALVDISLTCKSRPSHGGRRGRGVGPRGRACSPPRHRQEGAGTVRRRSTTPGAGPP